ncbi:MAG: hypothetical protein GY937_22415 [bacterium]|nr:hypothetical protein [bacterium]
MRCNHVVAVLWKPGCTRIGTSPFEASAVSSSNWEASAVFVPWLSTITLERV